MNRRAFMKISGCSVTAGLLGCTSPEPFSRRPNILFIPVDDLRPELGCYGNGYVKSPHIDRLAREGVLFRNAYCQSAVCNPSRASLLTGLRPDSIKVWDLRADFRDHAPDAITLPQYFKDNGYNSVGIGKIYHNTIPDDRSWNEKAYLEGYPFDPDAVYANADNLEIQERKKQAALKEGREMRHIDRFGHWYLKAKATEEADVPDHFYFDGAQTDWAIAKLKELKDREEPFFLAVGYYRPHLPFNAPKKYWDLYDREKIPLAENDFIPKDAPSMAINNLRELRGYTDFKHIKHPTEGTLTQDEAKLLKHGYFASVSYIDTQVGRLMDELERLGLRDNTVVVLWGDHGWKLGEHNSWCKMTNYEIDTRVPLIVSAPRFGKQGIATSRLVEFVDIYPTLCDLAGLPVPGNLEGLSMAPLMTDPNRSWKNAVFTQFLREGGWVGPDGQEYMGYAIRTERYRYVEWVHWETKEISGVELYDLQADLEENENLADRSEYQAVMEKMKAALKKGWRAALPE